MEEFKKTEYHFKFEGENFELKQATMGQLIEHGEKEAELKDGDDLQKIKLSFELLEKCNIPKDVTIKMEAQMIGTLVQKALGISKKK